MKYSIFTNGTMFIAVCNGCNLTKSDKESNESMVSSAMYNLMAIDDDFTFVRLSNDTEGCEFLIAYK